MIGSSLVLGLFYFFEIGVLSVIDIPFCFGVGCLIYFYFRFRMIMMMFVFLVNGGISAHKRSV
jgi:hypothetical protein